MSKRNQNLIAGALVACVVALAMLVGNTGAPGTRSGGTPSDADYVNVLLVPSVAEEIGLDMPMRIRMAKKGERLLYTLRNGSGHMPIILGANEVSDKRGSDKVEHYGRKTREVLPDRARKKFDELFADGKLVRVGFWTEKKKGNATPYFVTYGWYDVEKDRQDQKTLAGTERELRLCHKWLSHDEAERLLTDANDVVRQAAERRLGRTAAAAVEEEDEDDAVDFSDMLDDMERREKADERRLARERRAQEREAFKARVKARQEAVRQKIAESRKKLGDE